MCFRGLCQSFRISVNFSLSHNSEKFLRWTLPCCVPKNSQLRKSLWIRREWGESIKIYRWKIFVSHCRNFRRGILYCCISFGYRKSLDKKEEGVSLLSFENFLSHSAEKFLRWNLLCCVSKNSRLRKSLWIRREWGESIKIYRWKIFVSHCRNFRRGILYCCISFGYRKSLDKKEEGVSLLSFEIFLSHSAEKFLRWNLLCCVSKISRLRKSLWIRREWGESIKVYRRKNFVSHCRNFRRGVLYCCISFGYRKSLDKKEQGVSLFSFENYLSHSAEKFLRWNLLCCVSKNSRLRKSLLIRRGGGRVSKFAVEFFRLTLPKFPQGNPLPLH